MRTPAELVTAIVGALGARRSGNRWMARCPAHDDRSPSLSITERDGRIFLHCFAGCAYADIVAASRSRGLWWPERARTQRSRADRARLAREYAEAQRIRVETAYFADTAVVMAEWALEELPTEDPERAVHTSLLAGLRVSAEAEYRMWLDRDPTWTAALVQAGRERDGRWQVALAEWIVGGMPEVMHAD
jgi:hypothetical protein